MIFIKLKKIETQALNNQINTQETAFRLARKKAKEVNERQEKRSREGEKNKDQIPHIMRQNLKNNGEKTKSKHADIVNQYNQK